MTATGQEYLVEIAFTLPAGLDGSALERLQTAERARSQELQRAGVLRELWRQPGRTASWSVWRVDGPEELDAALRSLPFFPWMTVRTHALARHPNRLEAP